MADDTMETEARAYCTAAGMDPDMTIGAGTPGERKMWQNAVASLRTLKRQLIALGVTVPSGP